MFSSIQPMWWPGQEIMTHLTVPLVRMILTSHEAGEFALSGPLAEHCKRNADVASALEQRIGGAMGLPFCVKAAGSSTNAIGALNHVRERWPVAFSDGSATTMLQDRIMMGFSVGRFVAGYAPHLDELVPTIERWHPSLVRYESHSRRWIAQGLEGEEVIVDEKGQVTEGWFVSFVGDRSSAHLEGAVRAIAEPFLGAQYASRDARRHSERMGQGILEGLVPGSQAKTDEGRRWREGLAKIGSTGVIISPQYESQAGLGGPQGVGFGVKLHFPPPSGMDGLLALDSAESSRIRRRILGQDTTSVDSGKGGGFARAKVGEGVRHDLIQRDAKALNDAAARLMDAWALFDQRPRRIYPLVHWDATPPEEAKQRAERLQREAKAMLDLTAALPGLQAAGEAAGTPVDVSALLVAFGVPVRRVETGV